MVDNSAPSKPPYEGRILPDMIKLAQRHNASAIHRGVDPEEGNLTYYFIQQTTRFDEQLTDAVANLELNIYQNMGINVSFLTWPGPARSIDESDIFGKRIWP